MAYVSTCIFQCSSTTEFLDENWASTNSEKKSLNLTYTPYTFNDRNNFYKIISKYFKNFSHFFFKFFDKTPINSRFFRVCSMWPLWRLKENSKLKFKIFGIRQFWMQKSRGVIKRARRWRQLTYRCKKERTSFLYTR